MMRSKLVAVFIIEVVTFMVQHLFWGKGDFLCVVTEGESNSVSRSNLAVLVFLLSAHLLRALYCWMLVAIPQGSLPQWAAYSKKSSVAEVAAEATMWTTLIVMTALTIEEDLHKCLEQASLEFRFSVYVRLHSAVHLLRVIMAAHACFVLRQDARRLMQVAVSGNKRRFVDEEFDLDLTYIADRLIAMALPCAAGAAYRNDIRQVSHFLTSQHYGGYKIFNLCEAFEEFGNGNYDARFFHQQVVRITMRDHNICSLGALVSFCRQATAFLNLDPSNVVVVHCRGGKGRTGTFCSALLLWSDFCTTALEALTAFATRRTVRYVHYIEAIKRLNFNYLSHRPNSVTRGGAVSYEGGIVYDHAKEQGLVPCYAGEGEEGGSVRFFAFDKHASFYSVKRRNCELFKGGQVIRYRISDDETVWGKVPFFAQWHTAFHNTPTMTYPRAQIDGVYTKSQKQFDPDFEIEVSVEGAHISAAEQKRDYGMRRDFHMTNSPSQRNLEELVSMPNSRLTATFRFAGAEELVFAKGDRVRVRGDRAKAFMHARDRSLMLIVSGHVAVFPDSRRKWATAAYFNPGLYRYEMLRGEGEMAAEPPLLEEKLGADRSMLLYESTLLYEADLVRRDLVASTNSGNPTNSGNQAPS
ncbi:hypothetical protein T484DRAFT_1812105 [Baffinella frigidus]|nr:hypothetical protein T484DRAFT_1812105 [Cryptophyta sp. CCMP2293]